MCVCMRCAFWFQFTFEGFIKVCEDHLMMLRSFLIRLQRVDSYVSNQDFCPGEVKYLAGTMTSWIGQKSNLSSSINQVSFDIKFRSFLLEFDL